MESFRKELCARLKREVTESIASRSLMLPGHSSEENYRRLLDVFKRHPKILLPLSCGSPPGGQLLDER